MHIDVGVYVATYHSTIFLLSNILLLLQFASQLKRPFLTVSLCLWHSYNYAKLLKSLMTAVVHTVTVKNGNNYLTGDLDLHSLTQLLK